jgi:hypothetical protein
VRYQYQLEKNMKHMILILLPVALLTGCAPMASKLNKVSVGMTKPGVIAVMGKPNQTSASQGVEYLVYTLDASATDLTPPEPYFIRLVGGKVDAYGRMGDFDSTQLPQLRIQVEQK